MPTLSLWMYSLRPTELRDRLCRWVAYRLPRCVVKWSAVRVFAHATTGQYGGTVVPELTAMDALKRWEAPRA